MERIMGTEKEILNQALIGIRNFDAVSYEDLLVFVDIKLQRNEEKLSDMSQTQEVVMEVGSQKERYLFMVDMAKIRDAATTLTCVKEILIKPVLNETERLNYIMDLLN